MNNASNWYGWIPILTNKLTLSLDYSTPTRLSSHSPLIIDWEQLLSSQSSLGKISSFLQLFGESQNESAYFKINESSQKITYSYKATLTDAWLELIKKIKHPIIISLKKNGDHIKECPSCKNRTLNLFVAILKPGSQEIIISADVYIHQNGLTLYELSDSKYSLHYLVNQIHKIVRDIFHKHVHHRSDLLLPTTEAVSDIEALCCFQKLYISKFLSYKKIIKYLTTNKTVRNYPEAFKLITLARGELLYAQNLIKNIMPPQLKEKNFFEYINKTLTNFEKYIENKKSSFFTLSRIGLSFGALTISFVAFFSSEIPPHQLYLAKFVCFSVVSILFSCGIAFGTRFINTYRHKCFSRIISFLR